jgi:hypothetical protein
MTLIMVSEIWDVTRDTDFNRWVAWTFLVGWPRVGRPMGQVSSPAFVSAKALTLVPYIKTHTLHDENHIRVEVLASKFFHFHILYNG